MLPVQTTRKNLYLVIDHSGSMNDAMLLESQTTNQSKYDAILESLHNVLFAVGHRVNYGTALFPGFSNHEDCDVGEEIDSVKAGDSVTYARNGLDGPHLKNLMAILEVNRPKGGTPTSATLTQLVPSLLALKGETSVILTTDGAPNCNADAECTAATCIANIEGAPQLSGLKCDNSVNCCAPSGDYGPYSCIDTDATLAPLQKLYENGIKTYVVGLPGTDAYRDSINRMADAGGTARVQKVETDPKYYAAEDSEALTNALRTIATDLTISCTLKLESVPPDWSQVNVYFDNGIVKMNDKNGWKKVDDTTLEVKGDSCTALRSGDVFQVQVVFGCPTVILQ
jgi:hypothetical protein